MDASKAWLQSDSVREREFYKYYNPIQALSKNGPSLTDITIIDTNELPKPCSSPDTSLTAFCQLGALRIGAQRCMLFFFDTEYAYVLAEATRTLSLQDDNVHDFEDNLWLGYTILRRGLSICEHTINVMPITDRIGCSEGDQSVYIINDLKADTTFCDRPFVTAGPKARFYAGVPITTPANIRIGVYCVLDDKPRNGLSPGQIDFLSQMSRTVMSHLETIRERSELAMGSNMLTGLGDLITTSTIAAVGGESHRSRPNSLFKQEKSMRSLPTRSSRSLRQQADAEIPSTPTIDRPAVGSRVPSCDSPSTITTASSRGSPGLALKANVDTQRLFHTAASMLRSTAEVDGSLFLDATIHAYGGAVSASTATPDSPVRTSQQGSSNLRRVMTNGRTANNAPCKVLGTSVSTRCDVKPRLDMSESVLEMLLRKYPRGKVWTFASDDHLDSSNQSSSMFTQTIANDLNNQAPSTNGFLDDATELKELQRLFPGVRGLCLVGMWDAIRERWYAATFIWTYSHSRVFSKSTELVFLIAFCDLLMTELTRLESQLESKAKSDFISSISHELRSPLQGILCGIDLLSEPKSVDRPLVSQIEQCSTTLLEIINHLLEFANINNLSGRRKSSLDSMEQHSTFPGSSSEAQSETVSIRKITEEVCDSTFYSHCCTKKLPSEGEVDFILDLSADADVVNNTAIGAWKRICMNIINNALKYTNSGHVAVSLSMRSLENGPGVLVLSVVDTGCGMSSEFMNNRLFRPFEQENDMSPGTGLGMSLVSKLVESLGGDIQVQSQRNVGTKIQISLPIDGKSFSPPRVSAYPALEGVKLNLLEPVTVNRMAASENRMLLTAALKRACQQLGAEMVSSQVADVQMIFESDIQTVEAKDIPIPIIVLCDNFISALHLQKQLDDKYRDRRIHCIAQPYGPVRLGNAIKNDIRLKSGANGHADTHGYVEDMLGRMNGFSIAQHPKALTSSDATNVTPLQSPKTISDRNELQTLNNVTLPHDVNGSLYGQPLTNGHAVIATTNDSENAPQSDTTYHASDEKPSYFNGIHKAQQTNSPVSLLLVDDNAVNLRMLVAYADKHAYHRVTAMNGQEAIDAYATTVQAMKSDGQGNTEGLSRRPPVVILLDINMPVMDGFEAARRIRALERSKAIPPAIIIAVTGLGSAEARQKAHASGMDLFLTKPVRPRDLTEILAPIVGPTPNFSAVTDTPG